MLGGLDYRSISAAVYRALSNLGITLGSLTVSGATTLSGVISPTQITGNQDDYNPGSLSSASVLRLSSDARRNVTGLQAGADGRVLIVHNVGTFPIVFTWEDAASTAANRFAFGCTLGGGQTMEIQYDATSSRWRAKNLPEPLGTIKDFGTATMPAAFLAINQDVSRTTYANLFNEVGTSLGAGDGATTFGLFADGALIAAGSYTHTDSGVDGDVNTGTDTLTVPSNADKWTTGKLVTFTLASGTITGLTSGNPYYIVRNGATGVRLASSLANAQNGTYIDLTAKSSPVWTITHTLTTRTLGQRGGEEAHAQSSTEQLLHSHLQATSDGVDNFAAGGGFANSSDSQTGTAGGNAAANVQNTYTVVTRGIRYA